MEITQELKDKFTEINGVAVVEYNLVPTPLSGRSSTSNKEIHYRRTIQLVLADGTVRYGCAWDECPFVAPEISSVVKGHWKTHAMKPDLDRVPYGDWPLRDILGRLTDSEADLRRAMAQRDRALTELRALKADVGDVAKLKKLLAGFTS